MLVFLAKTTHNDRNMPAISEEIIPFELPILVIFHGDRRKITPRNAIDTDINFFFDISSLRKILPNNVVQIGCVYRRRATIATGVPNTTPPNWVNCNNAPIRPYAIKKTRVSLERGIVFLMARMGKVSKKRNNKEYADISYKENPRFEKNCPPGIISPQNIAETIMFQYSFFMN
jgi:hypothetical protein